MISFNTGGLIAASALALLGFGAPAPSAPSARPTLSVANVMLCDKPDEVAALVTSGADDLSMKLSEVNARFGKASCNVVTVAFYRGEEAKTVLVPNGIVRIIRLEIVGVRTGDTWVRLQSPIEQYAGLHEAATDV
jgi:hypothetical protein